MHQIHINELIGYWWTCTYTHRDKSLLSESFIVYFQIYTINQIYILVYIRNRLTKYIKCFLNNLTKFKYIFSSIQTKENVFIKE